MLTEGISNAVATRDTKARAQQQKKVWVPSHPLSFCFFHASLSGSRKIMRLFGRCPRVKALKDARGKVSRKWFCGSSLIEQSNRNAMSRLRWMWMYVISRRVLGQGEYRSGSKNKPRKSNVNRGAVCPARLSCLCWCCHQSNEYKSISHRKADKY